jgi:hypothetical protein
MRGIVEQEQGQVPGSHTLSMASFQNRAPEQGQVPGRHTLSMASAAGRTGPVLHSILAEDPSARWAKSWGLGASAFSK